MKKSPVEQSMYYLSRSSVIRHHRVPQQALVLCFSLIKRANVFHLVLVGDCLSIDHGGAV